MLLTERSNSRCRLTWNSLALSATLVRCRRLVACALADFRVLSASPGRLSHSRWLSPSYGFGLRDEKLGFGFSVSMFEGFKGTLFKFSEKCLSVPSPSYGLVSPALPRGLTFVRGAISWRQISTIFQSSLTPAKLNIDKFSLECKSETEAFFFGSW